MKKTNDILKCLVTHDVIRTIIMDSRQFIDETGGVLIGTFGNQPTIVAAGASGENSYHHTTSFTSDAHADRECLASARQKYGSGVGVLGWWHKHPSSHPTPTKGDFLQARSLMDDYEDNRPLLMGIVRKTPSPACGPFSLRLFTLGSHDQLLEHPWKRVTNSNKELLNTVNAAPPRPDIRKIDFWTAPDFQFYQNPIGRERILRDIKALKQAGWHVSTTRRKSDKVMLLDLTKGGTQLQMELPPEFPLNPPTVFANGQPLIGMATHRTWNSLCPLTKWTEYAENILIADRLTSRPWRKDYQRTPLLKE